ncbi:MAG: hypothetical protein Q8M95_11915 [Candidatus Methanoperedens sp.]|nr:hypothetical protein [Candidatus Methanoperedens sp.]
MKSPVLILIGLIFSISMGIAQTDNAISGNQSYNIRVVLDHIFISKNDDSVGISEIVVFRNEGPEIYYSGDNHTYFAISTPPGVENLKTDVMGCCLVQEEAVMYMDPMKTIKTGENFEMKISYELGPWKNEDVFNKSTVYNTTSLSIFVDKKSGADVKGLHNSITLSGKEYYAIVFEDLKPGDPIEIPVSITAQSYNYYAGAVLIILLLSGFVYHFRAKLFRKKKEYTLEELELEKEKIFQAIHGFEKHTVGENSEEYMRLMEEYRLKGIDVIMKIDKIKKGERS